ncbi:ATP-binding protein [Terriglobus roseus]|uniref:histidine kinase n=1 Tax=Terriglobus roseus TaxID=392734 RepID=A0A1G7GRD7_9BACT|nr:ATP-binding protein [Terriglobus roseus]SDE90720.1 heavy metal sensor kinase [Terriglobus roseus]
MIGSISVRARLALLYTAVAFTGLVLFGALTYGILYYAAVQGKETHLIGREDRLKALLHTRSGTDEQELLRSFTAATHEGNLIFIRNSDGTWLFPTNHAPDWKLSTAQSCIDRTYSSVTLNGEQALVLCHIFTLNGRSVLLYIGGAMDEEFFILRKYRNALFLLLPVLMMLSVVSGYFLSRHALKPVDRMTSAALEIGIGNLSKRLPVPEGRDEIQRLAIAWNQLLSRLEAAVSRLSRFSADASHDIRTSITVMLATAQLSLNRPRTDEEYRRDLEGIVVECRTATTLLDALLTLSQSDNFIHEAQFKRLDLCDLVVSSCRRLEDLAESSGIVLDWYLPDTPVVVEGDEVLLQRLLGILLDNAIRYTPQDGEIRAEVLLTDNKPSVIVRDTGVGMTESVRRRVFDRYYQADLRERKSRAGNGLGLSIGLWIADAHGAELTVESEPQRGSTFFIRFPVQPVEII